VLIACSVVSPTPETTQPPKIPAALPSSTPLPLISSTPTFTPPAPSTTPIPMPSPTAPADPTPPATLLIPIAQGASIGSFEWSPDSHWLPIIDFQAQRLHFYDALKSATCDFPVPIHYSTPYAFLAWLSDGRVVVQATDQVLAGRPCETFAPASADEIRALDSTDPSFSPDGRYQVVFQRGAGNSQGMNATIELKELVSGKILSKTAFTDLPRGGGNLPGSWLDPTHFLIAATGDQGPLLISPGQPVIQVAPEFFHLPLRPGNGTYDAWMAIKTVTANPAQFHLMLSGTTGNAGQRVKNPLQLYHSESGQVETLPYLANQASFSDDGHWLLVNPNPDQSSKQNWIRPIDPAGSPFELLSDQIDVFAKRSPDGTKVIMGPPIAGENSVFWVVSSFQGAFLSAWQAPGYELSPDWSPDGRNLSVWGRRLNDPSQQAIFVVRLPNQQESK
jgi:hypothetical protein